ncbi:M20/M25/M40 family metallo-hydrolase [Elusimicrobiota bacterium]
MAVIDFLEDLINIPSLSGEELILAGRIREELNKLNYDEVIEANGNICGRKGSGDIVILYDAHMDVVEPGKGWVDDPFNAKDENGFIVGRGSCDDKGSLAAMIYGGAELESDEVTLYVLGSVKEEVAEGNGLSDFLSVTKIKPDFVVIGEPSSLRVAKGNRGRLGVRLDIKGKAGHASDPDLGDNAVYRSIAVIEAIKGLNSSLEEDSVVVTKVETPNKNINIIPESCSIYCDYRSGAGRKEKEILGKLKDCISEKDKITAITPYYKPWQMEEDHPLIWAAAECMGSVIGRKEIINWKFCTNGSYIAGELGIPTVGFGPGVEEEAHSSGEKISRSSVETAVDFFTQLPRFICKGVKHNKK